MESGMLADAMNEIRRFWGLKINVMVYSEKRGDVNPAQE